MKTILDLAQAWLEHCRDEFEFFTSEAEDDVAQSWFEQAEKAERIIKNFIDKGLTG